MESEWQEDKNQAKKARGRRRALTPPFLTLTYFGWSQALATNTWMLPQAPSEACAETLLWTEAFIFTRRTPQSDDDTNTLSAVLNQAGLLYNPPFQATNHKGWAKG